MSTTRPRAAIYLRISQDREDHRLGVNRHREDAQKLADRRGYDVVAVYDQDNDVSGAGSRKREAFEKLLVSMEAGELDVVIAQEWARLERNRSEGVRVIETAKRRKITLAFVKGLDIDLATGEGEFVADLLSGLARREIAVKAERQSSAQVQRARQGRVPKGTRPLGYATSGEQIPHEAEAVRAIFKAFHAGAALLAIARALSGQPMVLPGNEKRQPTKVIPDVPEIQRHDRTLAIERNAKRVEQNKTLTKELQLRLRDVPEDKPWAPSTVLGILRNPRYAGYSTYQAKAGRATGPAKTAEERVSKRRAMRDAIVRDDAGKPVPPNGWEAIVSEELWWSVQTMLDDKERATNTVGTERRHTGSGIYLCGVCGRALRSHSRGYRCQTCKFHRKRDLVDAHVDEKVRERLGRSDLANLLPAKTNPRVEEIAASIDQQRAEIARAQDDYMAKLIDGALYRRIKDQADAEIERLEVERRGLLTSANAMPVLAAKSPVEAWDEADLTTRRAVLQDLGKVYLHPQQRGQKGLADGSVQIDWY